MGFREWVARRADNTARVWELEDECDGLARLVARLRRELDARTVERDALAARLRELRLAEDRAGRLAALRTAVWRTAQPGETPGELTPQLVETFGAREYGADRLEDAEAPVVACWHCGQPSGAGHVCGGEVKEAA